MKKIHIIALFAFFLIELGFSQSYLDEMVIEDISNDPGIKSTIIRDSTQSLLIVITQISDLRVESNNRIIKSEERETGKWFIQLVPGTHRLTFQSQEFLSIQKRFFFKAKETQGIRINVKEALNIQNTGIAIIRVEQEETEVIIDNESKGFSPLQIRLESGIHVVKLKKPGFFEKLDTLKILNKDIQTLNYSLDVRFGTLYINSSPAQASVYLNDKFIIKTPAELTEIPLGEYKLKISYSNYDPFITSFSLTDEVDLVEFSPKLKLTDYSLNFAGTPGANLFLNENNIGIIPLNNHIVKYGEYELEVSKLGYHRYFEKISIDNLNENKIDILISLKPKNRFVAMFYSMIFPGLGQSYEEKNFRKWFFFINTVITAAGSVYYTYDYNQKVIDYEEVRDEYELAVDPDDIEHLRRTMDNSYDKIKSTEDMRNIFYFALGTMWLSSTIDALILPKGWQETVQINSTMKASAFSTGVTINFN